MAREEEVKLMMLLYDRNRRCVHWITGKGVVILSMTGQYVMSLV